MIETKKIQARWSEKWGDLMSNHRMKGIAMDRQIEQSRQAIVGNSAPNKGLSTLPQSITYIGRRAWFEHSNIFTSQHREWKMMNCEWFSSGRRQRLTWWELTVWRRGRQDREDEDIRQSDSCRWNGGRRDVIVQPSVKWMNRTRRRLARRRRRSGIDTNQDE